MFSSEKNPSPRMKVSSASMKGGDRQAAVDMHPCMQVCQDYAPATGIWRLDQFALYFDYRRQESHNFSLLHEVQILIV